jgi:hypothetical protein
VTDIPAFPSLNSELTLDTLHSDRNFPILPISLDALLPEPSCTLNAVDNIDTTTPHRLLLSPTRLIRMCRLFGRRSRDHASIENG